MHIAENVARTRKNVSKIYTKKKKVGEFFNYTTLGRMNNCRSVKRKFPLTKFYIVFGWLRE